MLDAAPLTRLDTAEPDLIPARCGCYWGVIQTHPAAEFWATANLDRQGFTTYLPLYATRRRDRRTTQTTSILVPLFSSYAFVQITQDEWQPIRRTLGVRQLMLASFGKPHILRPGVLEAVQATEALRRTLTPPDALWRPGTPCTLSQGPFAGLPAVVTTTHHDEATIAVMFLGHLRSVSVPLDALAPRGDT